jgi:hypothetical protein
MNIGKIIYPALALVISGRVIPSAPPEERMRPGTGLRPVLSEHMPSPFKMPKPVGGEPKIR